MFKKLKNKVEKNPVVSIVLVLLFVSLVGTAFAQVYRYIRVTRLEVTGSITNSGTAAFSNANGIDVSGGDITLENDEIIINATDGDIALTFNDDATTLGQLYMVSSIDSPLVADNDIFEIVFQANDDSSNYVDWVTLQSKILDASDDSEDSELNILTWLAGTEYTSVKHTGKTHRFLGNVIIGDSTTGDVDAVLYFADDASLTAESIIWDDGNDQFLASDDIKASGFTDGTATLASGSWSGVDDVTMTGQIDGGVELAGTLAFTTSDTCDTLANASIGANDIFVISLKDTAYAAGVGAIKGYVCKAGTLFVARKTGGTSASSWSYVRIK